MSEPAPSAPSAPSAPEGAPVVPAAGLRDPPPRPVTSRGEPDWIREAFLTEEVLRYGRTLRDVFLHPRRFGARWVAGEGDYQNPVRFLAVSTTAFALTLKLAAEVMKTEFEFGASLMLSIVPYAYFLGFGLLAHVALKGLSRPRQWSSTAAVALFAGGGPGTLASLLAHVAAVILKAEDRLKSQGIVNADVPPFVRIILFLIALAALVSFYAYFFPMLRGLHRTGWVVTFAAVAIAFIGMGLLLGLDPDLELKGVIPFRIVFVNGRAQPYF